MAERVALDGSEVARYAATYLQPEIVQDVAAADTDPQIASLIPLLQDWIAERDAGVIIDLGCGNGTLLKRLAALDDFKSKSGWVYAAVDFQGNLEKVSALAKDLTVSRKVELVEIGSFYKSWPDVAESQIVVCRNVIHELSIQKTANLLSWVARNISEDDIFLIQDLAVFPEAERHNACWLRDKLADLVKDHGFERVSSVIQATRGGNSWLSITAKQRRGTVPSEDQSLNATRRARAEQWHLWAALEAAQKADATAKDIVRAIDLDLQLASLTRQLLDAGMIGIKLDDEVGKRVRMTEITKKVAAFVEKDVLPSNPPVEEAHFRERGDQLNKLEGFLRGSGRIALVWGGVGTGKTTFIKHLLHGRLYAKSLVMVDLRASSGFWPAVEQIFAQLDLRVSSDLLSVAGDIEFSSIRASIGQFLNAFSSRIVFVFENLDAAIDSNGGLRDKELASLVELIVSKDRAKVIFSSRGEYLPGVILAAAGSTVPTSARMGRYGTDQTVINVLDDVFDRGSAGIDGYPAKLIDAIDRHPLVASLAAKNLSKSGSSLLLDEKFINELRQRMLDELRGRLVDSLSESAVDAASNLRIPAPLAMLERLAPAEAVHRARASEVLYSVRDRRWGELIYALGLFRKRRIGDALPSARRVMSNEDDARNEYISTLYMDVYRQDDDPKWVREAHFHTMISGAVKPANISAFAGKYYLPELIASANYCFQKKHDYSLALELFNSAASLTQLDETSLMRMASSLIRVGRSDRGESEFKNLVEIYPNNFGIKMSHVDALLSVSEFEKAMDTLGKYNMKPEDSTWVAQQWGRTYLGLDRYSEAIAIFSGLLATDADPYRYVYLARALQQYGDLSEAIRVLKSGAEHFPNNVAILTSLGADLERKREDDDALAVLEPLFEEMPDNARAGVAIIRILIRSGDLEGASKILWRAERAAPSQADTFLISARAEILIASGRAKNAIETLKSEIKRDPTLIGILLEAFVHASQAAGDDNERDALLAEGMQLKVPERWRLNVPVQVNRARMALKARNRLIFDEAIANLNQTRIEPLEIQRLQQQWDAGGLDH